MIYYSSSYIAIPLPFYGNIQDLLQLTDVYDIHMNPPKNMYVYLYRDIPKLSFIMVCHGSTIYLSLIMKMKLKTGEELIII
jgi:hypothetical protein